MKKTLLTCSLIVSSCFFALAQFQVGGANVNVGKVCGTINGRPACINPSTGQYEFSTGNGKGVTVNANTGAVGVAGSIGGVKVGFTIPGTNTTLNLGQGGQLLNIFNLVQTLVARAVPLLIGIALLAFFWFLIEFIWKGRDNPEEQKKSKAGMGWAILALFVMVSVWGIIGFMGNILGINQGGTIKGYKNPGEE
jgi:hypothetical protein